MAEHEFTEPQRAWIDALRSGKYQQTKNVLCVLDGDDGKPVGFCCLGVACDLAVSAGINLAVRSAPDDDGRYVREYDDYTGGMPPAVKAWLGLNTCTGCHNEGSSLAVLNDDGAAFEEIADLIESRPAGLLVEASA